MTFRQVIVTQFERPHGLLGRAAGWIMAHRPSNRERNRWTVDLLNIQPADRILELGCGPGLGLEACLARATLGLMVGIDHSQIMLDQARARNAWTVATGRLQLRLQRVTDLRPTGEQFDKIFSINVIQFLDDPRALFHTLHSLVKPGGLIATTYMPRGQNPTRAEALARANEVKELMERIGFAKIRIEELPLEPALAVCMLGERV